MLRDIKEVLQLVMNGTAFMTSCMVCLMRMQMPHIFRTNPPPSAAPVAPMARTLDDAPAKNGVLPVRTAEDLIQVGIAWRGEVRMVAPTAVRGVGDAGGTA